MRSGYKAQTSQPEPIHSSNRKFVIDDLIPL